MSFLSLPSQDGLFTAIKAGKSATDAEARSRTDAGDDNEEEVDDDDTEDVRLIPRCSPVPRKRGASIYEETAEYMRIHFALAAGKRVSFADTTGGDLVDVREFVAFDSDEESDSAKWEQEQAKYRKPDREPTYSLHLEFQTPPPETVLHTVRNNKVEVEQIAPAEDDPLAFRGVIRVLNVSFHKAVYIRSTMDNWSTYFDHPAEYVQGSHHEDTDRFSFKLCFAPPFTTHGSRIEFVVRYETAEGDFWANNSSLNYGVTLLLSYEDEPAVAIANTEEQQIRSILRPPKVYSLNDEPQSDEEQEREEEEAGISKMEVARPVPVCPVIIQPDIDLELIEASATT
ncbi:hypothetical protein OJAV_G00068810 [Oryzias javanicus]|uniref:CBM21 domain-containing protein n=1 Tax=Oryzias javanicus TaxID=123683 RepID=A0A437D893_ORYJA|nr:hypothetical protein OJAV_G00068810 [Oryzias javanicus]